MEYCRSAEMWLTSVGLYAFDIVKYNYHRTLRWICLLEGLIGQHLYHRIPANPTIKVFTVICVV